MKENKIQRLETDDITKLLIEFSWPAIAGMVIHSCYNIISRMYIGNIGDYDGMTGLAAITVCFPIMLVFFSVAAMCGLGGSALYSIRLGEKDYPAAGKVLGTSIWLVALLTIIPTIAAFANLDGLLRLFGASDSILPYARDYLTIIMYGSVFGGIGFTVNAFSRTDGSPSVSMYTNIIGAVFNIAFTPLFLFVMHMGMKGAALATVGGQLTTMIWVLLYFRSRKATIRLTRDLFVFEPGIVHKILAMGAPPFAMQIINCMIMFIVNKLLVKYGGDMAMSAMGIVMSLQTIMIMPIVGISQGAQPIMGYNFGASNYRRVVETLKQGLIGATAVVLFFYAIVRLFPGPIISMFGSNPELRDLGVKCMEAWFMCIPFVGIQIIGSCYFQSVGKVMESLILTSTRQLIFFIPAAIVLPMFHGFNGLIHAAPLADLISSAVTGVCLYLDVKKEGAKRGGDDGHKADPKRAS